MGIIKVLGFDNEKYLEAQTREIMSRVRCAGDATVYIEFGGKAYDDQHAARVLPGYDPNNKVYLLKELSNSFEIVIAVSARDILKPRIRGDSQLFYDSETLRIVNLLRDAANIHIRYGVVTMWPHEPDPWEEERLEAFLARAYEMLNVRFLRHGLIRNYPSTSVLLNHQNFATCPKMHIPSKHVLVFSPGGGSGKFSFCLSQLISDFLNQKNSVYLKFETFPVFKLPPIHPLNLAFVAATADLGNKLINEGKTGLTTYDKDLENFQLLKGALRLYSPNPHINPMIQYQYPSDMGVNRIVDGFIDEQIIVEASREEIHRRAKRYEEEISRGIEYPSTMRHFNSNLHL
jgi:uncharacterized protein (UPF0371 family)